MVKKQFKKKIEPIQEMIDWLDVDEEALFAIFRSGSHIAHFDPFVGLKLPPEQTTIETDPKKQKEIKLLRIQKFLNDRKLTYELLKAKYAYLFAQIWYRLRIKTSTRQMNKAKRTYRSETRKLPGEFDKWYEESKKSLLENPYYFGTQTNSYNAFYDEAQKKYENTIKKVLTGLPEEVKKHIHDEVVIQYLAKEKIVLEIDEAKHVTLTILPQHPTKKLPEPPRPTKKLPVPPGSPEPNDT